MVDIDAVLADRCERIASDDIIRALISLIDDGSITMRQVYNYAKRIGDISADVLVEALSPVVSNGDLISADIATGTLGEVMKDSYARINTAAHAAQLAAYEKNSIPWQPIKAAYPKSRVDAVVESIQYKTNPDDLATTINSAVPNVCNSYVDDFLDSNAKFAAEAGAEPTITRSVIGNCCKWCERLAGTYRYDERPADVFKRHNRCDCIIDYRVGALRQNVHTKTWYIDGGEAPATIQSLISQKDKARSPEEAAALDKAIRQTRNREKRAVRST